MSTNLLIIGETGQGKSASLRAADPKTTFLISALNKPLPFPGWRENWKACSKENPSGNWMVCDNAPKIRDMFQAISERRPEIKAIIVDDFQYIMGNEFMRRASEKGWDKFSQIGENAWNIIFDSSVLREDLIVAFLSHSETTENGFVKIKTIGKMLDEKITLEGMFTTVLRAVKRDGQYVFLTQSNGSDVVKAPMGMFKTETIENDLNLVLETIRGYK